MQNLNWLKPPSKFSFKPKEWSAWIKQFRCYCNASKLAAEAGETQRVTSYNYVMGEESEKIFETLHFGTVAVGEGEGARKCQNETLTSKRW